MLKVTLESGTPHPSMAVGLQLTSWLTLQFLFLEVVSNSFTVSVISSVCCVKAKIHFIGNIIIFIFLIYYFNMHSDVNRSGLQFRNQRFYAAPAIHQVFEEGQNVLIQSYQQKSLVLCGDARMDSPGFSATKATYSFMEHDTHVVLHMEIGDTWQVYNNIINCYH